PNQAACPKTGACPNTGRPAPTRGGGAGNQGKPKANRGQPAEGTSGGRLGFPRRPCFPKASGEAWPPCFLRVVSWRGVGGAGSRRLRRRGVTGGSGLPRRGGTGIGLHIRSRLRHKFLRPYPRNWAGTSRLAQIFMSQRGAYTYLPPTARGMGRSASG